MEAGDRRGQRRPGDSAGSEPRDEGHAGRSDGRLTVETEPAAFQAAWMRDVAGATCCWRPHRGRRVPASCQRPPRFAGGGESGDGRGGRVRAGPGHPRRSGRPNPGPLGAEQGLGSLWAVSVWQLVSGDPNEAAAGRSGSEPVRSGVRGEARVFPECAGSPQMHPALGDEPPTPRGLRHCPWLFFTSRTQSIAGSRGFCPCRISRCPIHTTCPLTQPPEEAASTSKQDRRPFTQHRPRRVAL